MSKSNLTDTMGSISRLSWQSQDRLSNYRVYACFCSKDGAGNLSKCCWIECYNPENSSWTRVTCIPSLMENQLLKGFAMVSIGEFVYIIGGRLCHKDMTIDDPDFVRDIDVNILSSVFKYDVRKDTWHKCAPMSTPRSDFACTISGNKIYVAGGQDSLGCAKGISSAEMYDPRVDEWKPLPNMSTSRYKCVGVTWKSKIFVVGGFAVRRDHYSPGPYMTERSSAEVYDIQAEKWNFMPRMWDLDVPPNQIVAVNGRLFSSGDCLNPWKGQIEAYDGKLKMWDVVRGSDSSSLGTPVSTETSWSAMQRTYLTMAPIGTRLYFLAGYRVPGELSRLRSEVHVFDTAANGYGWRSFEPTEEEGEKELCCHCCVLKQYT